MTQKQFIITIPMLREEELIEIEYQSADASDLPTVKSRFPGIALLEWNLSKDDEDVHLTLVMTDDDNHRSERNLEIFIKELEAFAKRREVDLCVESIVTLPHNETSEKQIESFRKLTAMYKVGAEVFCDITFGTKVTPICIFASLAYAEQVSDAIVKSIIYGKYSHDDGRLGTIYDIRCVYELNMTVNAMTGKDKQEVDEVIDFIWGRS